MLVIVGAKCVTHGTLHLCNQNLLVRYANRMQTPKLAPGIAEIRAVIGLLCKPQLLRLALQRYAQTNVLKRTIFELIAEELIKSMTDQLAHTPELSTHGGGHADNDKEPQ